MQWRRRPVPRPDDDLDVDTVLVRLDAVVDRLEGAYEKLAGVIEQTTHKPMPSQPGVGRHDLGSRR